MNKIYKVMYSKVKQCAVVVSEIAKNHGHNGESSSVRKHAALMAAVLIALGSLSFTTGFMPMTAEAAITKTKTDGADFVGVERADGLFEDSDYANHNGQGAHGDNSITIGLKASGGDGTITIGDRRAEQSLGSVYVGRGPGMPTGKVLPDKTDDGYWATSVGYQSDATGYGSIAIGSNATANNSYDMDSTGHGITLRTTSGDGKTVVLNGKPDIQRASVAIGYGASADNGNIAIGSYSDASTDLRTAKTAAYLTDTTADSYVSVGKSDALRRISNVADGADVTDAATVGQLQALEKKTIAYNEGWGIKIGDYTKKDAAGNETTVKNAISVDRNLGNNSTSVTQVSNTGLILGGDFSGTDQPDEKPDEKYGNYGATGQYAVTLGGRSNRASGESSVAAGGMDNTADGNRAFVGGGYQNTASGDRSSAIGGDWNTASGVLSSAIGGSENTASGDESSAIGGDWNTASGRQSSAIGGCENTASGTESSAIGGWQNIASGWKSSAFGGIDNISLSIGGSIGGSTLGGMNSVVLGNSATGIAGGSTGSDASNALAAGSESVVTVRNGTAIGYQATTNKDGTIAFGHDAGDVSGYTIEWEQLPNGQTNADETTNDYTKDPKSVTATTYTDSYYNRLVKVAEGQDDHDVVVVKQLKQYAQKDAGNIGSNIKVYTTDENGNSVEDTDASTAAQKANENLWGTAIGTGKIADSKATNAADNGSQQLVTGGTVYTYNAPVAESGKTLNYVSADKTTGQNLTALDTQVKANADTLNDKTHNIKYYSVEDKISDDKLLPSIPGYLNDKNDGAKGAGSMAAGFSTHADGVASTVAGSYSGVVGTGLQGAAALSYGTFNVNLNAAQAGTFSGVANSIVGQANVTTDSNAAIIYGAGNTVTNSYRKIDDTNASEIMQAALSKDVKKLDEALQKAVPTSGGQVMVMGGGNNVESAYMTQVVGVGNTVKGNQVKNDKGEWVTDTSDTAIKDYDEKKSSHYNYVDGFNNDVINGKHDYIIGANNTLTGDSYDDDSVKPIKKSNQSNIVIGDNHTLDRKKNTVIIGSSDTANTVTNGSDAVIIGHNANAASDTGADNAVAIGLSAKAAGGNAVSIGANTSAGDNSITIGSEASAVSGSNLAIGRYARVYGNKVTNAVALGQNAKALVTDGVAIGSGSQATVKGGSVEGYDPATGNDSEDTTATWKATKGAVSIGTADGKVTRQINGLAAGTNDTDAVNVAQLKKLNGMKANVVADNIGTKLNAGSTDEEKAAQQTNLNAWGTAIGTGTVAANNGQLVTGGTVFNETRISAKDNNGQTKTYKYLDVNASAGKNLEALDSALQTVNTTAGAHTALTIEGGTPAGTKDDQNKDVYVGKNILLHESTDDTTGKVTYDLKLAKDINIGTPGKDGEDGKIGIDGRDGHIGLNGSDGITVRGLDGENGAPGKDGVTITGPKGADGIDGKVGISGTDGKDAVSISGKDGVGHIGLTGPAGTNGKDGTNAVDITVKNGYDGANGINGKNGVDGTSLTRIVYTDNTGEHQVATMEDGLKFKGDDTKVIAKKLNNTMEIIGGADSKNLTDGNIGVNSTDKGQLKVQLAKDLTGITSISNQKTEGDKTTGAKITLGSDGSVDVSGGKITNVGSGVDASGNYTNTTNAANIGDVQNIVKSAVDSAADTTNKALADKANVDASNIGTKLRNADGSAASAEDQKANAENWGSAIGTGEIKADDGRMVTGQTVYNEVRPTKDGSYVKKNQTTGENLSALDSKIGKLDETKKYNYIDSKSTTSISDNLGKLDTQVKNNADAIQNITNNVKNLSDNAVQYDNTNKTKVTLGGGEDGTTITNVKDGALGKDSKDAVNGKQLFNEQQAREAADNAITEKVTNNTNEITKIKNGDFTDASKTAIKNLAKVAVQVKAGTAITVAGNVDDKGNKTYTISANNDGKVEKNDGNLISGDTLYNEVRPAEDGSYVKKDKTTGDNLSALDTNLKTTSDLIHTNDKGDTIQIGESSSASKIDVHGKDGKGRVITGVVTDAGDPTSAANVGYVNGVTAANTQQIYRDMNNAYGRLNNNINKAAAGSNALAALHPLDYDPDDKADFAVGYGHYRNANAAAVGAFYHPNENTMVNVGVSLGNGDPGFNAGVSFKIGSGSAGRQAMSKTEMAKVINSQSKEIDALKKDNADKDKRIDALEQKMAEILAKLDKNGK